MKSPDDLVREYTAKGYYDSPRVRRRKLAMSTLQAMDRKLAYVLGDSTLTKEVEKALFDLRSDLRTVFFSIAPAGSLEKAVDRMFKGMGKV